MALDVRDPSDLNRAFQKASDVRAAGILLLSSPILTNHSSAIVALAKRYRLPVMFTQSAHVRDGGLISYGPDAADLVRRSADYVAKILRGAKTVELPVEQPTKFELVVNLKVAKAFGLTIPATVLVRADEVLE
jgi:putative ABC transport system substrate-binding protein